MGRGHGGYTDPQPSYKDSGGQKVIDKGAIFVGERYMDLGYETVFRGRRNNPLYDLTIKTSDDTQFVKNIEVYGEMHRYIPYLAKNAGFTRIGEKPVHHQKRKYGKSKFGMSRFVNGFLDLMSLWFLSRFGGKPMHFFGTSGILMFLTGFVMAVWIIVAKLVHQAGGVKFRAVTDQPLFYLALVAIILGVLFFLAGFIGEMVSRNAQGRNSYQIKERLK